MSKKRKLSSHRRRAEKDDWTKFVVPLPFQGRVNRKAFEAVTEQFMAYEEWVSAGRPDSVEHFATMPQWYIGAAYWNDTAFQYMRHSTMSYLRFAASGVTFGGAFLSLARSMRERDPDGYAELLLVVNQASDQFERQHQNARRIHRRMKGAADAERLELALQWYVSFFETNLYLWFLCVLARYMRTGAIEAQAFGGPLGSQSQGSLVQQALGDLANTPLAESVEFAYDPEVRNSLSHNDYELTDDRSRTLVLHPSGRTLSWNETWEFLVAAQDVHENLFGSIATVMTAPRAEDWFHLREYGVVSLDWSVPEEGPVYVVLHQLWCFAELDPDGCWLDGAELRIETLDPKELSSLSAIRFATAGLIVVPADEGRQTLETALHERPWVIVARYPVAPYLGLGYPRYGENFEVVGPADQHLVRYAGGGSFHPSDLPPRPEDEATP